MKLSKPVMTPTALVTTILIIALGIWDLIMVVSHGTGSTVSQFLIYVGFKSPVFVFATGCVCGHLFCWMRPEDRPE